MARTQSVISSVRNALKDKAALDELLEAIAPENKDEKVRNHAFRSLMLLAQKHPEALLPRWDDLVRLLKGGHSHSKYPAIHILAELAIVETGGRFQKAFNAYYGLLDDESIAVAAHVAGLSGKIAKARPALEPRITEKLLSIDGTHFDQSRKDLIKGYAIESFAEYFNQAKDKKQILGFVQQQKDAVSPRARKAARSFLKQFAEKS
jgi:HEAT repeat protein